MVNPFRLLKPRYVIGSLLAGLLAALIALPVQAQIVDENRLLNADREPENWILHHRTYDGQRFSPLDQINLDTVGDLRITTTLMLGGIEGAGRYGSGVLEGTPLVENGFMYVTDGWGGVYKIDVRDGQRAEIVWKMDPGVEKVFAAEVTCCGIDNRGAGLWRDQVISVALDGRLISTNKETGEVTWERKVADPALGETLTLAPLIVKDLGIIGSSGAEYGIRGWIDATDLNTGEQVWRTHTIPGAGEPGNETWLNDAWQTGGGSIWVTGTYDPELNLMYWGTGNPGPDWDAEYRPGDNLYTDSLLAMDPDTGEIKWWFQYTPNDPYDYDEIAEHILVEIDGKKLALHAGRNGFFYGFDRVTGEFLYGKQYVDFVNWTPGLDPKTGVPLSYDPARQVQLYAPGTSPRRGEFGVFCPDIIGGKNWMPAAYSPETELMYIPSLETCRILLGTKQEPNGPRDIFLGADFAAKEDKHGNAKPSAPIKERAALTAVSARTGEVVRRTWLDLRPNGALATAGDLVFAGDQAGELMAFDARTLEKVWSWNVGSPIKAPPMSYSWNGKQYLAILVGGPAPKNAPIIEKRPGVEFYSPAAMLFIFTL